MRLRRFLMTEPTVDLSGGRDETPHPTQCDTGTGASSACLEEGPAQILLHRFVGHPEGPPDAYRLQLAGVHQPVDGHLGYPHPGGNFGDRQEPDIGVTAWAGRTNIGWSHFAHRTLSHDALYGFPTADLAHVRSVRVVPVELAGEQVAKTCSNRPMAASAVSVAISCQGVESMLGKHCAARRRYRPVHRIRRIVSPPPVGVQRVPPVAE